MQETIAAVIHACDRQGKYLDDAAIDRLKPFWQRGDRKVGAAQLIREHAAVIVKEAVARSLSYPASMHPRSMQATRYYAACVRDLDFFPAVCHLCHVGGGYDPLRSASPQRLKRNVSVSGRDPGGDHGCDPSA